MNNGENDARINAHIKQLMRGGFRRSADDLDNPLPFIAPLVAEGLAGAAAEGAEGAAGAAAGTAGRGLMDELASALMTPIAGHIGDKIGRQIVGADDDEKRR